MTMVPAPKISKPHLFFYGGCGAGSAAAPDFMSRFTDGCGAAPAYAPYDNHIINGNSSDTSANDDIIANNTRVTQGFNLNKLDISNANCVLGSELGVGHPTNNSNYSYHNIFLMAEEEQSRTSNSTSVDDDGDDQQPAAAATPVASSTSIKGRDDTPTPPPPLDHRQHQQRDISDRSSSWLQLGLGRTHVNSPSAGPFDPHQHHPAQVESTAGHQMGGGKGSGLMLELKLGGGGGGGGLMHQTTTQFLHQQRPLEYTSSNMFGVGGGVGSASSGGNNSLIPQHHPMMIPLITPLPYPHQYHQPHQLLLSEHHHQQHQIGWGLFVNQRAAAPGCSSSLSPSSSSSMPPAQAAASSLLSRPFMPSGSSMDAVDSDFRLIHPPPRRPHSGIWFTLQASPHQSKEPFLPQVSKKFLRIRDGRMTVRLVMKYVANKLGLDRESEVEIRCRGQQLVPFLTLQHVRDNIWIPRDAAVTVTLLPDSSTTDHLMVLNYGRSSNYTTTSSTYLELPLPN